MPPVPSRVTFCRQLTPPRGSCPRGFLLATPGQPVTIMLMLLAPTTLDRLGGSVLFNGMPTAEIEAIVAQGHVLSYSPPIKP